MVGVLFVCMGNICRSPMAEGMFRKLLENERLAGQVDVDSAGTHGYHIGSPPDSRARKVALNRGIDLEKTLRVKILANGFEKLLTQLKGLTKVGRP